MDVMIAKVVLAFVVISALGGGGYVAYEKVVDVEVPKEGKQEVVLKTDVDTSGATPVVTVTPQTIDTPESHNVGGSLVENVQKVAVDTNTSTKVTVPTETTVVELPSSKVDATQPGYTAPVEEPVQPTQPLVPEAPKDILPPKVLMFTVDGDYYALTTDEELASYSFNLSHSETKRQQSAKGWGYTGPVQPYTGDEVVTLIVTDTSGNSRTTTFPWKKTLGGGEEYSYIQGNALNY